jgi:hypothetical protein
MLQSPPDLKSLLTPGNKPASASPRKTRALDITREQWETLGRKQRIRT